MKNSVKNSICLLALTFIFSASLKAQQRYTSGKDSSGIILSAGPESGFTLGNTKTFSKWYLGGSVQADIPIASQLFFTANAGYLNFFSRSSSTVGENSAPDLHLLPVMAGFKYFPVPMLYIQGDAGAAFLLNKSSSGLDKSAAFLYVPQVGVQLPIGGRNYVDAGVRYEGTTKFSSGSSDSKISALGLRIAYNFGL
jgi:hypothetical protein